MKQVGYEQKHYITPHNHYFKYASSLYIMIGRKSSVKEVLS